MQSYRLRVRHNENELCQKFFKTIKRETTQGYFHKFAAYSKWTPKQNYSSGILLLFKKFLHAFFEFYKTSFFRTTPDGSYFLSLHRSFFIFLDLFDSNRVLEENLGLNLMSQCRPYIRNTYYVVISFIQNFEATQWKCWCNVLKSTSSGRCEFDFAISQLCQRCHYTIYDILWGKLAIQHWGNVDKTF